MQTGQNSIAPENSLPQIEQMRWGSLLMDLTDLRMRCIQLYEILVSSSFKAASTVDLIREVVPERGAQGRPEFTFEPAQLG
jgi:hypothetical protein